MLKYLLAAVAGLAALFLGITIGVLIMPNAEKLGPAFGAGCAIAAARGVFVFFRNRERMRDYGSTETPAVLITDIRNFEKAFLNIDLINSGITEVKILEHPDQTSFFVGLRSKDYSKIDAEAVRKSLYNVYYSHVKFEFRDLNAEEGAFLVEKGINIPLKNMQG